MIEREEQIFQIWVKHPYAGRVLITQCGKKLRIISPGILNTDSGPDFFDARIELDGQVWVGNIEIHVKASDWIKHGHTTDRAFRNVVLHVVVDHDMDIRDDNGDVVPVLVLTSDVIVKEMLKNQDCDRDPEVHALPVLKTVGTMQSLESLGVRRLDRRVRELQVEFGHLNGDMEALFQRHLFRRFGMKTNSEPFQQLAHRVPGKIIRRQRNNLADLEALLYGQSGLLPEIPVDAYSADLLYRYVGLKSKYCLEPMHEFAWKFMRMRPSNFPTIRISQLAVLLHTTHNLYGKCAGETTAAELNDIFDVNASVYWDDHFRFGVYSGNHRKHLGEEAINSILINVVALLRYYIGAHLNDSTLQKNALGLLKELPAEDNKLIRESGRSPGNALESQGLLELLTQKGGSNDENLICSEPRFPYISVADYDKKQVHRQDRCVV